MRTNFLTTIVVTPAPYFGFLSRIRMDDGSGRIGVPLNTQGVSWPFSLTALKCERQRETLPFGYFSQ